jgi:hypothetical protein
MKIEEVFVGQRLRICGKYLLSELNSVATVLEVIDVGEWANVEDFLYPHGMVKVRLADHVNWPVEEVWIGPEDLTTAWVD